MTFKPNVELESQSWNFCETRNDFYKFPRASDCQEIN